MLTEFLKRMRLMDPDASLSWTTIILVVVLVKFAVSPLQTEALIALLGAMAQYQSKKLIGKMGSSDETTETIAELGTQVTALSNKVQLMDDRTKGLVGGRR